MVEIFYTRARVTFRAFKYTKIAVDYILVRGRIRFVILDRISRRS